MCRDIFNWIATKFAGCHWLKLHLDVFQLDRGQFFVMCLVETMSQPISIRSRPISIRSRSVARVLTQTAIHTQTLHDVMTSWHENLSASLALYVGNQLMASASTMVLWFFWHVTPLEWVNVEKGFYSLSGRTSYRKISWSLEAARLDVVIIESL